jgi:hypothetical protein
MGGSPIPSRHHTVIISCAAFRARPGCGDDPADLCGQVFGAGQHAIPVQRGCPARPMCPAR